MPQVEPSPGVVVFSATAGDEEDERQQSPACGERELDYFLNRARAERAAAKSASCSVARSVHQTLAQQYAALSQGGAGEQAA